MNTFTNPPFTRLEDIAGLRVTIMGLGLNGGGLTSAQFFAEHGAQVTVTDFKTEAELAPSIEALKDFPEIKYVLGRHDIEDFKKADLVIKNPGVKLDGNVYLAAARSIETDLSVFLRFNTAPIIAVTGSKGKSSTVSAIHFALKELGYNSFLGGNITVSPLSFLDQTMELAGVPEAGAPQAGFPADSGAELVGSASGVGVAPVVRTTTEAHAPVVVRTTTAVRTTVVALELSSWQLADLKGRGLLKPKVACITPIMADHQNWYGGMEPYVADKKVLYADLPADSFLVCNADDSWGPIFAKETASKVCWYSTLSDSKDADILPDKLTVLGSHNRQNLLIAAKALSCFGCDSAQASAALARFPGIEHRLEFFHEYNGIRFYNDSAATIPDASVLALQAFDKAPILLTGGTDKELDFSILAQKAHLAKSILLLKGSGTDKLIPLLQDLNIPFKGPFESLEAMVQEAFSIAVSGDNILFSPGATSFGIFLNEFDRGRKFKNLVLMLTNKEV